MNIQEEVRTALSGFIEKFGFSTFGDFNVADLADLLVHLNDVEKAIIHRIEVALDEKGEDFREALKVLRDFIENHYGDHDYPVPAKLENALKVIQREDGHTTPVYVKPGVTVKEVGLGASIRPEAEVPTGQKDYRKMLEEAGGWDNELAPIPAGGVREVIVEVESLRVRVAQLDSEVNAAREILRPIRRRVGAGEGEHILTAFERKFAELEKAAGETTISPPPGATKPCPHCGGSGKEVLIDSGPKGPLSTANRTESCSRCGGSGAVPNEEPSP